MKHTILLSFGGILLAGAVAVAIHQYSPPATLPTPPLKEVAQTKSIEVGNFAIRNLIHDKQYQEILTSQFNLALLDNTPNWYFTDGGLRPGREEYYFDHMDEVVKFASSHNMQMQAHHYLWGEEKWLPEWLKTGMYSQSELDAIMRDHILTVGGRYKGQIQEWTVVNEAFTRGQGINGLSDWWQTAYGSKDFIDKAFLWAKEADPNAKLILNDFGNETINSVSDEMYNYIKDALDRGVPIDGIGLQMHIDGATPPKKEDVLKNMERFGDLGVNVYVTEFDVNMTNAQGTAQEKDEAQADVYYDMTRACIESGSCKSFAILGVTDKETWYSYVGNKDPRPLPFDENYRPKPAFYALHKAFSE